ncbi:MAG: hypothetical protein LBO03_05660 [Acidaminococcales bacterium]|nr:hypothetical protein [Acidaminococcales bacterium]
MKRPYLFEHVQIFVISNGAETKHCNNAARNAHIKDQGTNERRKSKKTSGRFEFASCWADANNKRIDDIVDFAKTFFAKGSIAEAKRLDCRNPFRFRP